MHTLKYIRDIHLLRNCTLSRAFTINNFYFIGAHLFVVDASEKDRKHKWHCSNLFVHYYNNII